MSHRFQNRSEAGRQLAERLDRYRLAGDTLVLGLPRGGIVPAAEVARRLELPLDVIVSHKLGAPRNPELAVGAVAEGGTAFVNRETAGWTEATREYLERETASQRAEIERRVQRFRGGRPLTPPEGGTVILVDDGVATGSTVFAAIRALREQGVGRIVLALPVAPAEVAEHLRTLVDELVVLQAPVDMVAVGAFYDEFEQVPDDTVVEILDELRQDRKCRREPEGAKS